VVRLARAITALGSVRLKQHNTEVVAGFLRALSDGAPFPQNRILPMLLNPALANMLLDVIRKVNPDQAIGLNAMLRNTVSPTILAAGKKVNVIPSSATAHVDGRVIPGQSVRNFLDEVERVIGPGLRINVLEQHDGTVFSTNTPLYDAICATLGRHDPGCVPVPYMIPGFTDSFAYARLGATCYGFSPVRLGPELNFTRMYHGHDERIPVAGFKWGLKVLCELVRDFCRAGAGP
jgi:acetylornithine deacetylase/succinyl-diaminopimelate desuccinylase-like protein